MSNVIDMRDWQAQHDYQDAFKRENHMVVPYADPETSERFLPDPDEQYDMERQQEIDDARSDYLNGLNEALRQIAKLQNLLR